LNNPKRKNPTDLNLVILWPRDWSSSTYSIWILLVWKSRNIMMKMNWSTILLKSTSQTDV